MRNRAALLGVMGWRERKKQEEKISQLLIKMSQIERKQRETAARIHKNP